MNHRAKGNPEIHLIGLLVLVLGCRTIAPEGRFEFTKPQMGAPFRVVLYAANQNQAQAAAEAVFQRVEQLNGILSDYDTDSELNHLSRTAGSGKAIPVSADLWPVLVESQRYAGMSDGAFDITVGPCASLWRKARREAKFPEPARLREALQAVGHKKLQLGQRTATLLAPNMKLDLGGIAKGYAVDEAIKVLKARGIRRALVAAAGDIAVSDPPSDKTGWQIEVGSPPKIISLANAAVSTSGDLFQHVELNGTRYSHIVDPKTGIGLTNQALVTVIAPDSTTADALATAISVLGPQKGRALARRIRGVTVEFFK